VQVANDYRARIYEQYAKLGTERWGAHYTEAALRRWADATRHHLRGWLPADKHTPILDMGCGHGSLLFMLREDGYSRVTGVDLSPQQIALAGRWCEDVHVADARNWLVEHPSHYGLIAGFDLIEHLGKDEQLPFLDKVYQALKPGGRVILQTPNASSPMAGAVTYGDLTHEWFFTPASLATMCRVAGFVDVMARERAPYPRGGRGVGRAILWQFIRAGVKAWNLVETGSVGGGIYSRVFVATAVRPEADPAK